MGAARAVDAVDAKLPLRLVPEYLVDDRLMLTRIASAAREDLMEWRGFAGEWLTELAFGELEGNEGEVLHSHLSALFHSAPELWVSCARADAALEAFCSR